MVSGIAHQTGNCEPVFVTNLNYFFGSDLLGAAVRTVVYPEKSWLGIFDSCAVAWWSEWPIHSDWPLTAMFF